MLMDGCPHLPRPLPPEGGVAGVAGGGQAIKTVSLQSLQPPLSLTPTPAPTVPGPIRGQYPVITWPCLDQ